MDSETKQNTETEGGGDIRTERRGPSSDVPVDGKTTVTPERVLQGGNYHEIRTEIVQNPTIVMDPSRSIVPGVS